MLTLGLIDACNLAIAISAITISVLGFLLSIRAQYMDVWDKRFFIYMFIMLFAYQLMDFISQISLTFLGRGYRLLSIFTVFFESLFSSVLMLMLTVYILHLCGETVRARLFLINASLLGLYIILLVFTQFTDLIYYFTEDNIYIRGPFYHVILILPILIMLFNLNGLYQRRNLLSANERRAVFLYIIIPMSAMVIQIISYGLLMIMLGTAIASLIMFVIILDEQMEKSIQLATRVAEQHFRLSALQIRPHFIYNTMSNIYYLCRLDPAKAQRVVGEFTKYLRNNFSAVVKPELIPFEDELEHTRAYLAVVKARYEDMLFVEYATEYRSFFIPPLTLEPIVENAVKHGLDAESDPLHILIRTAGSESTDEITVENTGTDFSFTGSDSSSGLLDERDELHVGLDNVSERLKSLCDGTLTISPRSGGGAVVTILIPAEH
ncbi:MAG: histidine kinase [Lachnospiraceae bacterium]|nr:histidine kinase [Lachnospiraceae bacterium]